MHAMIPTESTVEKALDIMVATTEDVVQQRPDSPSKAEESRVTEATARIRKVRFAATDTYIHSSGLALGFTRDCPTEQDTAPSADVVITKELNESIHVEQAPYRGPSSIPPILNDRMASLKHMDDPSSHRTFTCFRHLPTELRLEIWRHSLQQRRMIRMYGDWGTYMKPSETPGSKNYDQAYMVNNPLGNSVSGQIYHVYEGPRYVWESRRFPSALMAVNTESREAALKFYYLRIPASTRRKYMDGEPTIYLNPDFDYVRFSGRQPVDMLDFLWDMRAYDRNGIGLRHWVVPPSDLQRLVRRYFNLLLDWSGPGNAEIGSILSDLETVLFSHRDSDRSRLQLFPTTPFDARKERHELRPISARPHGFDLLDSDPRPGLFQGLSTLWVKGSPIQTRRHFDALLAYFAVRPGKHTRFCHMVSTRPCWKRHSDGFNAYWISSRQDLADLLLADAAEALDMNLPDSYEPAPDPSLEGVPLSSPTDAGDFVGVQRESNTEMGLPPREVPDAPAVERVAGFWLFETEEFGEVKETLGDMTRWSLAGARPRLGVYQLSGNARLSDGLV